MALNGDKDTGSRARNSTHLELSVSFKKGMNISDLTALKWSCHTKVPAPKT